MGSLKLLLALIAWPLHWAREGRGDIALVRFLFVVFAPIFAGSALLQFGMWQGSTSYLWMCVVGFLLIWETRPSKTTCGACPVEADVLGSADHEA